jgi:hypothetical protein
MHSDNTSNPRHGPRGSADEQRRAQSEALWRMTPDERERAMWSGELTYAQLREWSSLRPDEVPMIGREFAWIVMSTPDWAEAGETTSEDELAA